MTPRLKLGYISHDFNDHPTAHMIEGIFVHHRHSKYETYAYSYGKNDNSVFRKRIVNEVEHFVDIAAVNYQKSANIIHRDQIDVLYDLQCHTRGNRVEIMAVKPSPIVVNFLIYPGAMGARWIDYLVGDSVVTPPEHAKAHYKAKLVLLPATYQVNYYPRQDYMQSHNSKDNGVRASIDSRFENEQELDMDDPGPLVGSLENNDTFVFCNFNKNDKLDPLSFNIWMRILKRVPNSVLWMLSPSRAKGLDTIIHNLRREAASHGVHPQRIIFAPRRTKRVHLHRFQHADLFVDSFVYGAHSTATDALRGGTPVLTLRRNNFASRVATSLSLNVGIPELTVSDIRTYENIAVHLATRTRTRSPLKRFAKRLLSKTKDGGWKTQHWARGGGFKVSKHDAGDLLVSDGGLPLFNIAEYTRVFERASEVMHETRIAREERYGANWQMHVAVGSLDSPTTVASSWESMKRTASKRKWTPTSSTDSGGSTHGAGLKELKTY